VQAGDDVMRKAGVVDKAARLLALLKLPAAQQGYIDAICANKAWKITKKLLSAALDQNRNATADGEFGDAEEFANMPAWMDREEVLEKGFCTLVDKENKRVGYWGWGQNGKVQISNFVIYPIFHVEGKENSRHIFEIENPTKRAVLDVPSKVFVSLETLQNHLVGEGCFIFYGSKPQLLRISTELLPHFPMCKEIKQLGWQPEGFFAFVNSVYIPGKGQQDISRWGIANVDGKDFLIPAASDVYANMRVGEDPYEGDRVLTLHSSPVDFKTWARQMHRVYGQPGLLSVAGVFLSAFYDIVFKVDNNCPHLYFYGERTAGKSKLAASTSAPFFKGRSPFQLNSGTDYAFFQYVSSFRNCPSELNEFDDKIVKDEWFQAIKGFFDGEGRRRGSMEKKGKSEEQKAAGLIILLGQFISTKDDNSVVTRSLIEALFEREFTDEDKQEFLRLKEWESKGITGLLLEILQHRPQLQKQYYESFNQLLGEWRRNTNDTFNQRVFQNWCHTATMWKLMGQWLELPVSFPVFEEYAYGRALQWSKFVRETDILSDFWNSVTFLLEQGEIEEGWDFKIQEHAELKIRQGNGEELEQKFTTPKKVLTIRLNNVHKLYQVNYRQRNGKEAMTLENLMHYFSSRNYYIGKIKQMPFKRWVYKNVEKSNGPMGGTTSENQRTPEQTITSAIAFDYDLLGCDLERINPDMQGGGNLF
jgi:hypothetical protein